MNKKIFFILLTPVYLLLIVLVLFLLFGLASQLNAFFYLILALFIPCAYCMSLPKQYRQNLLGTIGYVLLGIFLAGSQHFDFQFQDYNAWLLLGGISVLLGIAVSICQSRK